MSLVMKTPIQTVSYKDEWNSSTNTSFFDINDIINKENNNKKICGSVDNIFGDNERILSKTAIQPSVRNYDLLRVQGEKSIKESKDIREGSLKHSILSHIKEYGEKIMQENVSIEEIMEFIESNLRREIEAPNRLGVDNAESYTGKC